MINELSDTAAFKALRAHARVAREEYIADLARKITFSRDQVDQRMVDERRGFWAGVHWSLNQLPKTASKDWTKFVQEALEEDEAS